MYQYLYLVFYRYILANFVSESKLLGLSVF
uniref:Uncharacterized protein n=1 Tax=Arundo donax TaxID=35708 RepID=A0A0A8YV56_ARUDO